MVKREGNKLLFSISFQIGIPKLRFSLPKFLFRSFCTHQRHEWVDHGKYFTFQCVKCAGDIVGGVTWKLDYLPVSKNATLTKRSTTSKIKKLT